MPTILERYQKHFAKDRAMAERAEEVFPDGVTSDSRVMSPFPFFVEHASGSRKWSISGHELIDYWSGHGALLLGHNPAEVVGAVSEQMSRGTHYGACHPLSLTWGALVSELIPSAERVRFTSSGTEANLMAIRLARTYTGRNKVLRLHGHYHGWQETVYHGIDGPIDEVPGIPHWVNQNTLVGPPGDLATIEALLHEDNDVACVILEPTGPCSGVVPLNGDFLMGLREITHASGALLIFDEVVTGFRVSLGGAQAHYKVLPDLTTLAKVLAGGLPGGAVTGRKGIMDLISGKVTETDKKVPHLGTYNANPLSASAGIATLKQVKTGQPQKLANQSAEALKQGFNRIIDEHRLDWAVYGEFSLLKFLIGHGLDEYATEFNAYECDPEILVARGKRELWTALRLGMLCNGVDLSLSSATMAAHSSEDVDITLAAFRQTLAWMKEDGLI